VELLGHYSNSTGFAQKVLSLLDIPPAPGPREPRPAPQDQHRLSSEQQFQLVEGYRSGATLDELALRFKVHRHTVSSVLDRHDVPRRYRLLGPEDLPEIQRRYESGESLQTVGDHFGVNAKTVLRAMREAGIPTRPRVGR